MSRVGVVGAGAAGLVTAKVLARAGHDVVVWDRTPDVGGVWSVVRRYPGVTTQSPRDTYTFSDFPMPKSYPEWPDGEQVQRYFADYSREFGVDDVLRLGTEVVSARPRESGAGWDVDLRGADGATRAEHVDELVIANGVFSEPELPTYPGAEEFSAAGGRLLAASELTDIEDVRGRDAVVVGYGKSACDVALEISGVAGSTHVVARKLLWKVPRKVGGVLNFKFLLLTRMGEALFRWQHLRGAEKFLHGPGDGLRRAMLNSVGSMYVKQFKLRELGLVPDGTMEDIVKGAIGLVTDGFFERVAEGGITVHRDQVVRRLLAEDGRPHVELTDGTRLLADVVVCGTGYRQELPFLDPDLVARLTDDAGNFVLYRQVLPPDVPHLFFGGYNSSFFSPLNAEMAALWTAAVLAGQVDLPGREAMHEQVAGRLAFMDTATGRHHQHGTKIIPFSMKNVDEILGDVGVDVSTATKANHWLNPVNPKAYAKVTRTLEARLAGSGITAPSAAVPHARVETSAERVGQ